MLKRRSMPADNRSWEVVGRKNGATTGNAHSHNTPVRSAFATA
ncbi:hypothetical protein [Prevotella sp. MGM2]|nr:hypothetical protein [Prevotella sp. MGM2]